MIKTLLIAPVIVLPVAVTAALVVAFYRAEKIMEANDDR